MTPGHPSRTEHDWHWLELLYFLLPISVDVRFGSPMGELSGSHHPEEEVAQHRVPTALCIQLDRSSYSREWPNIVHLSVIVYRPTIDGVSTLPENWTYHSKKYAMFLEIGVKKLRFESGKGLDFLKSENAMRTAAVQKCATLLSNVRGVPRWYISVTHKYGLN